MNNEIAELTKIAEKQKEEVLAGNCRSYLLAPPTIVNQIVPTLLKKYSGEDARDAGLILMILWSRAENPVREDVSTWACPTIKEIGDDLVMSEDEVDFLLKLLEREGLLIIKALTHDDRPSYFPIID